MNDEQEPIVEVIKLMKDGGLENDKALLRLCEIIIQRVVNLQENVMQMHNMIIQQSDRIDMLVHMYHTKFTKEVQ